MPNLTEMARSIFLRALAECSIERAFDRFVQIETDGEGQHLLIKGRRIVLLNRLTRLRILSIGKAGAPMLRALLTRLALPSTCDLEGVLIAPERLPDMAGSIQFFAGGHPVPNEASFAGAAAALAMLEAIRDADPDRTLCLFLISGGASSMMELPLDPAITLADTIAFHRGLVAGGATIVETNCVRKHFSAVKGGRLAVAAGTVQKISLLISDVPPEHLDALASGPTIGDPTTVQQCLEILARYQLADRFPASIRNFFAAPNLPETPKPRDVDSPVWTLIDGAALAEEARAYAASLGYYAVIDNACDDWSYDRAADYLLNRMRTLRKQHTRVCLISSGELSVKLPDSLPARATGGRNQHFVLDMAIRLRAEDGSIAILSAGSDGIDGNSPAAGAVVDEGTLHGARKNEAEQALAAFDSYTWLSSVGATVVTGPTGHNLRDLRILLADTRL